MTKLLEQAVEAARSLPPDAQDDLARTMLRMLGDERAAEDIDPDHLEGVLTGLSDAARGAYATEDEVEAAFRRFKR